MWDLGLLTATAAVARRDPLGDLLDEYTHDTAWPPDQKFLTAQEEIR